MIVPLTPPSTRKVPGNSNVPCRRTDLSMNSHQSPDSDVRALFNRFQATRHLGQELLRLSQPLPTMCKSRLDTTCIVNRTADRRFRPVGPRHNTQSPARRVVFGSVAAT